MRNGIKEKCKQAIRNWKLQQNNNLKKNTISVRFGFNFINLQLKASLQLFFTTYLQTVICKSFAVNTEKVALALMTCSANKKKI